MGSDESFGNNGVFIVPLKYGLKVQCIASDAHGWDHVSVVLIGVKFTPSWEQMCIVKSYFWDASETVLQFHPPRKEYVNNHPYCLHLWKSQYQEINLPPSILVGIK